MGSKIARAPFGAISRLPLGSPRKNSHLDVASVESCSDALPSLGVNPLEGPIMLSCGKMGLEGRSQFPTLKRGRGAC